MNKALVLAALLGLAASTSVSSWSKTDNLVTSDMLTLAYMGEFDFGYGSHYMGTDPSANQQAETYGIHLYSEAKLTLTAEFFEHYQWMAEFEFVPAYFAPYEHTIIWSRIDNSQPFSLTMVGSRDSEVTSFMTTITENIKTFEVSLYDVIVDGRDIAPQSGDWSYNGDYEHEYDDQYWQFNLLQKLDVIDGSESWYGSHNYFSKTF